MQAGLQTRYIIHEILKILRTRAVDFDKVFLEKIKNQNLIISDRKMIHNVVLNTMRHHLYINEIIKKFSKKLDKSSDSYYLLLSSITQLLIFGKLHFHLQ